MNLKDKLERHINDDEEVLESVQRMFQLLVVRGCFKTDRDYDIATKTYLEIIGVDYEENIK